MTGEVTDVVTKWYVTRAKLAAAEQRAHPDITDRFGRVWRWRDGNLYTHDDTLAFTLDMITSPDVGLPAPGLAQQNPNYAGLCRTCRQESDEDLDQTQGVESAAPDPAPRD